MDLFERVNKLNDDDLMTLLEVLKCEPGKEWDVYKKRPADEGEINLLQSERPYKPRRLNKREE